ncbi:MAG: hypothetical protein M3438_05600 [Pseudomonadota bacterium]|nr:hypothetical protein [Pseudomonadota bacterium]
MAKARITFALERTEEGQPAELLIYLNPEGRDLLVEELTHLDEQSEHFHLQDETWTIDVPLQTRIYNSDREVIIDCVKILFRLDEWDRRYFPHVIDAEAKE